MTVSPSLPPQSSVAYSLPWSPHALGAVAAVAGQKPRGSTQYLCKCVSVSVPGESGWCVPEIGSCPLGNHMATGELEEGGEGGDGGATPGRPPPRWPDDPRRPFKRYQLKTDPSLAQIEDWTYIFPTLPPPPSRSRSSLGVDWNFPSLDLSLPPKAKLITSNNEQQGMIMWVKWTTDGGVGGASLSPLPPTAPAGTDQTTTKACQTLRCGKRKGHDRPGGGGGGSWTRQTSLFILLLCLHQVVCLWSVDVMWPRVGVLVKNRSKFPVWNQYGVTLNRPALRI